MNAMKVRNLFLLLASTLTIMAGATLAPALPGMKAAFAAEENAAFWVKIILSVPGLFIAICAPFIGWLTDRWNKKYILVLSLIAYGLFGTAGYFLNDSLQIILWGRMLLGIAVAGVMVAGTTLAGDYFKGPELGKFMGLQAAFGSFGGVVFMGLGGILADINWTIPFLIYLFAFLILPGIVLTINEPVTLINRREGSKALQIPQLDKKTLFTCYGMGFLEVLILYLIPLHFPFYANRFGVTEGSQIGLTISFMFLVVAIVSMNYKRIDGKLPHSILQGGGFLLIGIGYVLMGLASAYWIVLAGMAIAGMGFGITRPNLIVWLFSFTSPMQRGRIIGGVTTVFFLAQFVSPILTQPFVTSYGMASSYLFAGLVCGLVGLVLPLAVSGNYSLQLAKR